MIKEFLHENLNFIYVWATYFNGDQKVVRVKFSYKGGKPYVRWDLSSHRTFLEPEGQVSGYSLIRKWEPVYPKVPSWHPAWKDSKTTEE